MQPRATHSGKEVIQLLEALERQHKEISELMARLESVSAEDLQGRAFEVSMTLSAFAGKLKVHLAQEDQVLYPSLLNGADPRTREVAQRFREEMGGLADAFAQFRAKYVSAKAIKENAPQFTAEIKTLAEALHRRHRAEEEELYPLVKH